MGEPDNAGVKKLQADLQRKRYKYATKSQRMAQKLFEGMDKERSPSTNKADATKLEAESAPSNSFWEDWKRWIAVGVLLLGVFIALCLVLPRRHLPKLFVAFTIGIPGA